MVGIYTETEWHFNPRPPCGGRHIVRKKTRESRPISIHVPRVEDDDYVSVGILHLLISIHVPRVEDDESTVFRLFVFCISIHVPRVEDDMFNPIFVVFSSVFQSTSPVWRTTLL